MEIKADKIKIDYLLEFNFKTTNRYEIEIGRF